MTFSKTMATIQMTWLPVTLFMFFQGNGLFEPFQNSNKINHLQTKCKLTSKFTPKTASQA